jgi:Rrf2 family cysteine metabolism transcriptional repressor
VGSTAAAEGFPIPVATVGVTMRLSARTEYAAIAAVELARRGDAGGPVGMRAICDAQRVPARFLVHILLQLKRAGIVASVRGAGGGYRLARPAAAITLRDIREAVDGEAERPAPLTAELAGTSRVAAALGAAWDAAARAEAEALARVTLADLAARSREAGQTMYYI